MCTCNALPPCFCRFPSLVSCTTIDWFSVWPADALKSVANKFLPSMEAPPGAVEQSTAQVSALQSAVEDACMLFHTSIRALAEDYRRYACCRCGSSGCTIRACILVLCNMRCNLPAFGYNRNLCFSQPCAQEVSLYHDPVAL